jgi:hypothetical protein
MEHLRTTSPPPAAAITVEFEQEGITQFSTCVIPTEQETAVPVVEKVKFSMRQSPPDTTERIVVVAGSSPTRLVPRGRTIDSE